MDPSGAGISGLPFCPSLCCWGHREESTLPCLNCLLPGRCRPLQGLDSGRHFHCIQLGFSSLVIVSRTHPDSMLIQALEFSPYVLPKIEVGAKGQWIERGGGGCQQFGWLLCFASPICSEESNALILVTPSTSNWVEVPFSRAVLCPGPYRTAPKPA